MQPSFATCVVSSLGAKVPQSKPSTPDPEEEPEISPSEPDPGDDTIDDTIDPVGASKPTKETKVGVVDGWGLVFHIVMGTLRRNRWKRAKLRRRRWKRRRVQKAI